MPAKLVSSSLNSLMVRILYIQIKISTGASLPSLGSSTILLDGEDSLHSDQDFYWREFSEFGLLNYGLDHIRHGREGFGQLVRRSLVWDECGQARPKQACVEFGEEDCNLGAQGCEDIGVRFGNTRHKPFEAQATQVVRHLCAGVLRSRNVHQRGDLLPKGLVGKPSRY